MADRIEHRLFDHGGHHRLTIDPAVDNQPAIRCYASVGFRPVGVMHDYERRADGSWAHGLLMEMLASDRLAAARARWALCGPVDHGVGDASGVSESDHLASTRAVYGHSADQYVDAVGTTVSLRFEAPLDRAVLDVFAESVRGSGSHTVLNAGCGPGRVAAYLAERGLDARGVDISAAMIDAARSAHPHLRFVEGRLTALPVPDGSLRGVVYWYSIITTPPDGLAPVWAELGRVLDGDGRVLVAFQAGKGEALTRPDAYGSTTALTLYRHAVAGCQRLAGGVRLRCPGPGAARALLRPRDDPSGVPPGRAIRSAALMARSAHGYARRPGPMPPLRSSMP